MAAKKNPTKKKVVKKKAKKKSVAKKRPTEKKSGVKGGRPALYTKELANIILARLADGESLNSICKDETLPNRCTVMRWYFDNIDDEFCSKYDEARRMQAENLVDDMLDIADEIPKQAMDVTRNKLRVDTRKWAASKILPKKYGERVTTEHDISDPVKELMGMIPSTLGPPSQRG